MTKKTHVMHSADKLDGFVNQTRLKCGIVATAAAPRRYTFALRLTDVTCKRCREVLKRELASVASSPRKSPKRVTTKRKRPVLSRDLSALLADNVGSKIPEAMLGGPTGQLRAQDMFATDGPAIFSGEQSAELWQLVRKLKPEDTLECVFLLCVKLQQLEARVRALSPKIER